VDTETQIPARTLTDQRRRALVLPRFPRRGAVGEVPPRAIEEATEGRPDVAARDRRYRIALAIADVSSVVVALVGCLVILGDDRLRLTTWLALPLVVAAGKVQGLYDRDDVLIRKTTMDEAPQLLQLATFYTLVFWLLDMHLIEGQLGKEQVLVLWATLFLAALGGRWTARTLVRRSVPAERCLFIGDAATYGRLAAKMDYEDVNADLVARMSLQRVAPRGERVAHEEDLRVLVEWTDIDRVIIESQALPADEMLDLVRAAKRLGVRVSVLPRVLDVVGTSVCFDQLHGMTILGVRRFGLSRSSLLIKRAFDVVGAALGVLAVAPLLLAIAIAIKLDTRGPVFFRQTRVGRDGRRFDIVKFRTMCADAEERKEELRHLNECDGGLFKMDCDPRVTSVGSVLRRTALDELPQLLNVLRGDMSLVGPRPLVVDEDERIKGQDRSRLQLTPGMTGHWQILGSSRVPLPEMVKIDYLYVSGWSLWSDLKILLRTVPYVLARRGR
jgi:exopolysaccharide biosynthesis polyprenyl glycosylphosphotransferase